MKTLLFLLLCLNVRGQTTIYQNVQFVEFVGQDSITEEKILSVGTAITTFQMDLPNKRVYLNGVLYASKIEKKGLDSYEGLIFNPDNMYYVSKDLNTLFLFVIKKEVNRFYYVYW